MARVQKCGSQRRLATKHSLPPSLGAAGTAAAADACSSLPPCTSQCPMGHLFLLVSCLSRPKDIFGAFTDPRDIMVTRCQVKRVPLSAHSLAHMVTHACVVGSQRYTRSEAKVDLKPGGEFSMFGGSIHGTGMNNKTCKLSSVADG